MLVNLQELKFSDPRGFLVIEGVNGAGKGTLIDGIKKYFKDISLEAVFTREPGSGELGKSVRSILLGAGEELNPLTELFLFSADRAEHVSKTIRPALDRNCPVISDRYFYSTNAFQGYGRGLNLDLLSELNQIATQGVLPDLVILLDIAPEIGLNRNKFGQKAQDNFEKPDFEFHNRIRTGFLEQARNRTEQFLVIDANDTAENVFAQAKQAIDLWLKSIS